MNKQDLHFRVADVFFRVVFREIEDGRRYLNSYAPFHVARPDADVMFTMTVGKGLVPHEPAGELIGNFNASGNDHIVYRLPEGGYRMLINGMNGEAACAFQADARFTNCLATLSGSEVTQVFGLNDALMIAFAFAGAYHNILLMHASVALNGGYGFLFLGVSGTGKSTHNDLWNRYIPDTEILNDDNPAVRVGADGIRVYGTPWSGKRNYYRQLSAPIGAYVSLEQAPENVIRREPKLQAFADILSSCSTMIWDKPSYNRICDTASAVASRVPLFHLKNRPEEAAARMSYEAAQAALREAGCQQEQ